MISTSQSPIAGSESEQAKRWRDPPREVPALRALIEETRTFSSQLNRTADIVHRQGCLTGGKRCILEGLLRHGPQTVPQMAKARQVSRQHVQSLVQPLCEDNLVEAIPNPAHRRSKLVRLTASGRTAIEAILVSESGLFAEVAREFSPLELVRVAATLRRLAHCFEDSRSQQRNL